MKNYRGKRSKKGNKIPYVMLVACVCLVGVLIGRGAFFKTHFLKNTNIEGVDCSYLTIADARAAIYAKMSNDKVTLGFVTTQYEARITELGVELENTDELASILNEQKMWSIQGKIYTLEKSLTVNESVLREYLEELPIMGDDRIESENAFIKVQADGTLAIEEEKIGNEINLDEAVTYCAEELLSQESIIDFTAIIQNFPEITSTDENLNRVVDSVNEILSTSIQFELLDGNFYTLDKDVMKDWVCKNQEGEYFVNIDDNLPDFVNDLNEQFQKTDDVIMFYPTGLDAISLPGDIKQEIDIEREIEQIKEELSNPGMSYTRTPIIKETMDLSSYVEIDLTRQKVWMYYQGECVLDGVSCVTGNVSAGNATPPGVFYLTRKQCGNNDVPLRGRNNDGTKYVSYVSFWMPFNGGIGMHDASWRSVFGGEIYKNNGSHGCVNMPYEAAKTVYSYIDKTMPIIVYSS